MLCEATVSVLTQPRPSRGFYVIRTFYFWCKQSFTCSACFWTGGGAIQPPSLGSGRAVLQFTRRSSDAARKDVHLYPITTTLEGVFDTFIRNKSLEMIWNRLLWLVMDWAMIRWVHSEIWDFLKRTLPYSLAAKECWRWITQQCCRPQCISICCWYQNKSDPFRNMETCELRAICLNIFVIFTSTKIFFFFN